MTFESDPKITHFGFKKVPSSEKPAMINEVFRSVAHRYDLMNDLMSFGIHRLWKRMALREANPRPGQIVLDVASGTGDLALGFAKAIGPKGKVVMTDINAEMLKIGKNRLIDHGFLNVKFILADAHHLPLADYDFDCVSIAFGLRNLTHQPQALAEMHRVLKPGGKLIILEFSQVTAPLFHKLYDFYSFNILPKLGEIVAHDRSSYEYLVESIRMHPNQETLKNMLESAGFENVTYSNLAGGIVALHKGYKY